MQAIPILKDDNQNKKVRNGCPIIVQDPSNPKIKLIKSQSHSNFNLVRPVSHYSARAPESSVTFRLKRHPN